MFSRIDFDIKIKFSGIDTIIDKNGTDFTVYFSNHTSNKIKINELSTGEKELIIKAFYLHLLEPTNKVILIDEPERSLHPKWQRSIMDLYREA